MKAASAAGGTVEGRRERSVRRAAAQLIVRVSRGFTSYLFSPTRSRKGGRVVTLTLTATALTIGVATAAGLQGAYEATDRLDAMADRAMAVASVREESPAARRDALMGRVQAAEQLRRTREADG